jgi:hypothetical protein
LLNYTLQKEEKKKKRRGIGKETYNKTNYEKQSVQLKLQTFKVILRYEGCIYSRP